MNTNHRHANGLKKNKSDHLQPLTLRRRTEFDNSSEWCANQVILSYGVRVGLQTNKNGGLDLLYRHLPPLWNHSSSQVVDKLYSLRIGKYTYELFADFDLAVKSRSLKSVLEHFRTQLKTYVAEMARRRVFVHAGAVGWNGKAIVIPGRSMSGKTSLVRELVRAGATYYSDEYAVLDVKGRVHPYPQPLSIRETGSYVQKNHHVETLGGKAGDKPLPVGLVIVTRYRDVSRWRPRQLSSGQGVLELLNNTVPARRKPAIVLPTLQNAVVEATILTSPRGEAAETVGLILKRL